MNMSDELRGFVDSDHCVSFRWFANVVSVSVEEAKAAMRARLARLRTELAI
jgi:hypothetical protein